MNCGLFHHVSVRSCRLLKFWYIIRVHVLLCGILDSFKQIVADQGWAVGWWSDDRENEARIKEETKATLRIYANEPDIGEGVCFYSGKRTRKRAYFARSY